MLGFMLFQESVSEDCTCVFMLYVETYLHKGVNAQFSLDEEILAFHICSEGEIDYHDNHSEPDQGLMKVLETSSDAIDMYLHHLPDKLSYDN